MSKSPAWERLLDLFDDKEDPHEPPYDPVHIGSAVILSLVTIGCSYWLLWTLLVFEGGIFLKLTAGASVLFTSKTLADFGYEESPYAMGAFEGWFGNFVALLLTIAVVIALRRLYLQAAAKGRKRKK